MFLIGLLGGILVIAVTLSVLINHFLKRGSIYQKESFPSPYLEPGTSWLMIRGASRAEIIQALALQDPGESASWAEAWNRLSNREVFVSDPVKDWVGVTGPALPGPADDIDAFYLFLAGLSRDLGEIQFYFADSCSGHHGWVRMTGGVVYRAFIWLGVTGWQEGDRTASESRLGLATPQYGAELEPSMVNHNLASIPRLCQEWSTSLFLAELPGVIARATKHTTNSK